MTIPGIDLLNTFPSDVTVSQQVINDPDPPPPPPPGSGNKTAIGDDDLSPVPPNPPGTNGGGRQFTPAPTDTVELSQEAQRFAGLTRDGLPPDPSPNGIQQAENRLLDVLG